MALPRRPTAPRFENTIPYLDFAQRIATPEQL